MSSNKKTARTAGVLYLLVGIFGGFAEGYVEPNMYVAGNAAATAGNVITHAGLVRMGVVADLIDQTFFLFLVLTLYSLLNHVNKSVARAMVALVVLAVGVGSLNAVFEFEGLRVATESGFTEAFGSSTNGVVLLLLDAQHYGLLVAQIFFGLWLAPLGYLAWKSGWFPKALCVLLGVGTVCYLIDLLAAFAFPAISQSVHIITMLCAVAEIWMVFYLLIVGVREAKGDGVGI